jgi:DNA-binding transcriptional MerR regulator
MKGKSIRHPEKIERATREPIAWIGFKPVLDQVGNQVLPLPQYGTREPDIQADIIAAEGFQRDIQNALGHFNAQDARLGTSKVTSGLALQELKASGDLGSFDFQDHYDDFLKFLGEQYNDLLDHYDDASKEVATRLPDDTVKMVKINTPTAVAPNGEKVFGPDDVRTDVGTHTITISTGPSSDSQRQAGKEAAMTLLGNPQAFPVVAADAMRLMDLGPLGDQMSKDLEFLQPPAMQQARQQKDGKLDPRMLQQQMAQLQQQLQHAEQVMQQQHQELEGKQAELASKEKIAGMQAKSDERLQITLQKMKDATSIAVAKINALTKGVVIGRRSAD